MKTILDKIVEAKLVEISEAKRKSDISFLKKQIVHSNDVLRLSTSLKRTSQVNLLAEIKKASPSKGLLCPDFDHINLATQYTEHGVAGISVLTDLRFQGCLEHLSDIKANPKTNTVPILRKDFILDPYQIYESRAAGADAILLIVAILNQDNLISLHQTAQDLGLDIIVEVHNESELKRALKINPSIIGINNRNLKTFNTDLETTIQLAPQIPSNIIIISESGINDPEHIQMLSKINVDAVLIGEALVTSADIPNKIHSLFQSV
jgi:indole-3-glycerol phosphate synthase